MKPDAIAELRNWANAIRRWHRPRVQDELEQLRAEAGNLHERLALLSSLTEQPCDAGIVRAAIKDAKADIALLEATVESAERARTNELRAIGCRFLERVKTLLQIHDAEPHREILKAASFLGAGTDGSAFSQMPVALLNDELVRESSVSVLRKKLLAAAEHAHEILVGHHPALSEEERLKAITNQLDDAIKRAMEALSKKHGVTSQVLAGILAIAPKAEFISFCRRRAGDARAEAKLPRTGNILDKFLRS